MEVDMNFLLPLSIQYLKNCEQNFCGTFVIVVIVVVAVAVVSLIFCSSPVSMLRSLSNEYIFKINYFM
jgi:hypothetical protein